MAKAGMKIIYRSEDLSFLGFAEVLKHIPFIRKIRKELLEFVRSMEIRDAVLIDYPGFNLSLAPKLKSSGLRIYYYIAPQVWAWGAKRIGKIRRAIDRMLVVFPFEEELFKQAGIAAEYVGHPLTEKLEKHQFPAREEFLNKHQLESDKEILLIMPGSRIQEIEKLFNPCLKAALRVASEFNMQIAVAQAPGINESFYRYSEKERKFRLISSDIYDLMKFSRIGIIKSGTSTLEAGYLQLPMTVVYSTSKLTYHIGKFLIKIKNISLVNILLGKRVVEELIQDQVNEMRIYSECKKLLSDQDRYEEIRSELGLIKSRLGETGASRRAAEIIYANV